MTTSPPAGTANREGARHLDEREVRDIVGRALAPLGLAGKRVLLIVPDATRTAPAGQLFRAIHDLIGSGTRSLDVLIALGTHPPMSDEAINRRLEITAEERAGRYGRVRVLNHAWNDPAALARVGTIPAAEIGALTGGLFAMDVPVTINRAVLDYDQVVIVGPVFPHEVVGFSGGNKYLFPGVGGPELLNFFHWLGAVITNPKVIGHKHTPVRRVVDRAAALVITTVTHRLWICDATTIGTTQRAHTSSVALRAKFTLRPRLMSGEDSQPPAMLPTSATK